MKGAVCTDGRCFRAKIEAFVARTQAEAGPEVLRLSVGYEQPKPGQRFLTGGKWIECKAEDCRSARAGIIVAGRERLGEKVTACADQACAVHRRWRNSGEDEGYRKTQAAGRRKMAIELTARRKYFLALGERLPAEPDAEGWQFIARQVIERIGDDGRTAACQTLGLEAVKTQHGRDSQTALLKLCAGREDVGRVVMLLLAAGELVGGSYLGPIKELRALGKRAKLDFEGFRARAAGEARMKELAEADRAKKREGKGKIPEGTSPKASMKTQESKPQKVQASARSKARQKKVLDKPGKKD